MTSVVTTVAAGDAMNTVPGWARATLDIRSSVPGDLEHALPLLGAGGPYEASPSRSPIAERGRRCPATPAWWSSRSG